MLHVALILLAVLLAPSAFGAEAISLSYGVNADGGCPKAGHEVAAEYRREGEFLDLAAYVRAAPSGTDCTVETLSYDLSVARRFDLGLGDWRAVAEFGASRVSTAALYQLADWDGPAHLAPTASLPAGAAEAQTASLGVERGLGAWTLGLGVNVVPIDWAGADGPKPRRSLGLRAAWEGPWGVTASGRLDTDGRHALYDAALRWRRDVGDRFGFSAALRHYGGLNDLFNPAPPEQSFIGQRFIAPSARDSVTTFELGLSWDLE